DLQRGPGGAIMQSIRGALLTAGYAAAVASAIAGAPADEQAKITDGVQTQLQSSFSSAEAVAAQHPQYASQITAAAKTSFVDGQDWAFAAGVVFVLLGAALVWFLFPRRDRERELLEQYHREDAAAVA
ncbi:MAG TPA: hypothetical protein PKA98_13990, partial [Acidimicrobiales bacterium]|nr:hypothetical protein [Acidimicrobiales bacterium]